MTAVAWKAATAPRARWAVLPVAEESDALDDLVPWRGLGTSDGQPHVRRWRPVDAHAISCDEILWIDVTDPEASDCIKFSTRGRAPHSAMKPLHSRLAWSGRQARARRCMGPEIRIHRIVRRHLRRGGDSSISFRLTCFAPPLLCTIGRQSRAGH